MNGGTPKAKQKKLTNQQFYAACDCLKKNKQLFLDQRPTRIVTAEMLGKLAGFDISKMTIQNIQEATGVLWTAKRIEINEANARKTNRIKILTICLYQLYKKFDEQVPDSLAELYNTFSPWDGK